RAVQLVHHVVVGRVILESPARVDHARHTETVQLAHEITRRQELMLPRELRPPGERRVEDGRIRPGDQQARRVARLVTLDVTPGRLWRVLRVPDGPQGRTVQQRPVVEVQRSEEHTSELQSLAYLVCRLLLEKKKQLSSTPRLTSSTIHCSVYSSSSS